MVRFLQGFGIAQVFIVCSAVFYSLFQYNYSHAQLTLKLEKEMETVHLHPSIFKRRCSVGPVESSVLQRMPMMYDIKAQGISIFKAVFFNQSNLTVSGCKISHLDFSVARRVPTFEDRWLAAKKALEPQLLLEANILKENMLTMQLEELDKRFWRTFNLLSLILTVAFFRSILKTLSECMYGALDTVLDTGVYLLDAIENLPAVPDTRTVLSYFFATLLSLVPFCRSMWSIVCGSYSYVGLLHNDGEYRIPCSYRPNSDNRPNNGSDSDNDSDSDDDGDNNNETGASGALQQRPTQSIPQNPTRSKSNIGSSASHLPSPSSRLNRQTKSSYYSTRIVSRNVDVRQLYNMRSFTTTASTSGEAATSASTSDPAPVTTSDVTPVNQPTATSSTDATPVSQANLTAQTISTGTSQNASVAPQVPTAILPAPDVSQVAQSSQPRSPKGKGRETQLPKPKDPQSHSSNESASAIPGRVIKPLRSRSRSAAAGSSQQASFPVAPVAPLPIAAASSEDNSSALESDKRKKRTKPTFVPFTKSISLSFSKSTHVRFARSTTLVTSSVQRPIQGQEAPSQYIHTAPPALGHYSQAQQLHPVTAGQYVQHATQPPDVQDDGLEEDLKAIMDDLFGESEDPGDRIVLMSAPSNSTPSEQQRHQQQISHEQPPGRHLAPDEFRLWQQHQERTQQEELSQWQRHQQELQHRELSQWQQVQYQRQHQELNEWRLSDEQLTHEQVHQWQLHQYQRQHEELSQWQYHQQQCQQGVLLYWQRQQQARQEQLYQHHFTEQQLNDEELRQWQLYDRCRPQEELHQWQQFRQYQSEREEQLYQQQHYQRRLYLQQVYQQQAQQSVLQDIQHQSTTTARQQMISEENATMGNEPQRSNSQGIMQGTGHVTMASPEENNVSLDMNSITTTTVATFMPEAGSHPSTVHQLDTTTTTHHRLFRTEQVVRGYVFRQRRRFTPRDYLSRGINTYQRRRTIRRKLARRARRTLARKQKYGGIFSNSGMIVKGPSNAEVFTRYQVLTRSEVPAQNRGFTQDQAPAQPQASTQDQAPITRTEDPSHFQEPVHAEAPNHIRPFTRSQATAYYYEELNNFQLPPRALEPTSFRFQTASLADALAQPTTEPAQTDAPTQVDVPTQAEEFTGAEEELTDAEEFTGAEEELTDAEELTLSHTETPSHSNLPTRPEALIFNPVTAIAPEAPSNFLQPDTISTEQSVIPAGADDDFDSAELFETLSMAIPRPPTPPRPRQVEEPITEANQHPDTLRLFDTDSEDEDTGPPLEPTLDQSLNGLNNQQSDALRLFDTDSEDEDAGPPLELTLDQSLNDLVTSTQNVSVYDVTVSTPPFFPSPTRSLSPDADSS
ncbi:hypothetical protein V8B55DRAFT_1581469 [Mucor lusitanicus]|uniref:Uncharacterized protein n=1 Tax=Mucor circinelloides f. lusitanicus TaxID=29924 RepID=A0A8H4B612_MUCCL|nr:hypothetical protein FB192DRAFT_1452880 [Mucor lusitanicus]